MKNVYRVAAAAALFLLVGLSASSAQAPAVAAERPNVLFVLTDDQYPGSVAHMGALKSQVVSEGVRFDNTVSTYPLCCPGRATIQRGQYSHNTKIYGNSSPQGGWEKFRRLGLHRSTVATWLDGAGYQTGLFGKYINNYQDTVIPPGWDRWYAWNGPKMGWDSVNDQGTERRMANSEADTLVADNALAFLDHRLNDPAPLFAFVNFGAMHEPYHHPSMDNDEFKGETVPRTPAFNERDVSDKPKKVRNAPRLSNAEVRKMDGDYRNALRSLGRVDRFIGDAVDTLRRHGELDNTYVVFYTDNGAHFGQHRLPHGKLQPYEEDISFPLIMRGPGIRAGTAPKGLVGNHDIAPTLADVAGAETPAFVDGRSVLPLATGDAADWPRTAILSEREQNLDPPPLWAALRMQNEVYIRHESGEKEYYDLATDPYQLESSPGSLTPEERASRERRLNALLECEGASCRAAEGQ